MSTYDLEKVFNFNVKYNLNEIDLTKIIINPQDPSDNGIIELLEILSKNNKEENIGVSLFNDSLEYSNIIFINQVNDQNNKIKDINMYDTKSLRLITEELHLGGGNKIVNKQFNGNNHSSKVVLKNSKIQKTKRFTKSKRK